MKILHTESTFLREIFIETFVDKSCEYYKERIQKRLTFSDGLCYVGYLWDCMADRQIVSQNYILDFLQSRMTEIYVFWDLHSRDCILIDNYWMYPKNTVLSVSPCEIVGIMSTLPEDCYFFDNTLAWAAVLTHEEIKKGRRLCYYTEPTKGRRQCLS